MKYKKINEENGSALVLIIIAMALITITISIISSQVNNQIRLNQNSYEDMQYKYLAEAGIEHVISDIKNELQTMYSNNSRQLKSIDHSECSKVEYDSNKKPIPGSNHMPGDTFNYLIYKEILEDRMSSEHQKAFFEFLKPFYGTESTLWDNFNELWRVGGYLFAHHMSYFDEFKQIVDDFIKEIDDVIKEVESMDTGTQLQKQKAIKALGDMKDHLIEIKCRLGLNNTDKTIEIPKYIYYTDGGIVRFCDNTKESKTINLNENGEVELVVEAYATNEHVLNTEQNHIDKFTDCEYKIIAKLRFSIKDNNITYEVLSYKHERL